MNRSQSEIMKYLQSRKTPATTGEITEKLGLTRQAILVNLKELLNKGYVSQSKKGRSFTWEIKKDSEFVIRKIIKSKTKIVDINSIKEFDVYEITKEQFQNPSSLDKSKYQMLILRGIKNWKPIVIDNDRYVIDGYHRLALLKYKYKKKKVRVVNINDLTRKENRYIIHGKI